MEGLRQRIASCLLELIKAAQATPAMAAASERRSYKFTVRNASYKAERAEAGVQTAGPEAVGWPAAL